MNKYQSSETGSRCLRGRSSRLTWILLGLPLLLLSMSSWANNILRDISFSSLPDRGLEILLSADQPISGATTFATQNPARIAIDLPATRSEVSQRTIPVGVGLVRSITTVEGQGRTRVVINLADAVPHQLLTDGGQTRLRLGGSVAQAAAAPPTAPPTSVAAPSPLRPEAGEVTPPTTLAQPTPSPARAPVASGRQISSVDFRRGQESSGRVVFILSDPNTVVDLYEDGGQVVLDFRNTSVPDNLLRRFDVADFGTPVKTFEVRERGEHGHVRFQADINNEYLAYQTDNEFTVEFRPLTREEREALVRERVGYTGERLSLNFQDIEVRAVLQLLGDFTGKNMVVADSVRGSITLRLRNVPWDQAMDLILKTRGLDKREDGNIILIAPAAELAAQEEQKLQSQQKIEELAPLHSEFFQINYAQAANIAALLKSDENQLLTPDRGNVTFDPRTNTLLVRDTAAKLEDLQRLITRLDIPVQQVLIEARVVVARDSFSRDIGVRLGFTRANRIAGTDILIGGGQPGGLDGSADFYTGIFGGLADGTTFPAMIQEDGAQGLLVNLPGTAAGGSGGVLNTLIGRVGSYLLQLELSAMQTEGKGEILSSPRIITADKENARIHQGVSIPYQSVQDGATVTAFQDATLSMDVTPSITPDDRVILRINVTKDEPDFGTVVGGQPAINRRNLTTNVLVDNGATVVLGGIFERENALAKTSVPFFGDLPVVGNLFRHRTETIANSELLIFVTPKILKPELSMR